MSLYRAGMRLNSMTDARSPRKTPFIGAVVPFTMLRSLRGVRYSFGVCSHTCDAHALQRIACALAMTQSEHFLTSFVPLPQSFMTVPFASFALPHVAQLVVTLKSIVGDVSALASCSAQLQYSEPASSHAKRTPAITESTYPAFVTHVQVELGAPKASEYWKPASMILTVVSVR